MARERLTAGLLRGIWSIPSGHRLREDTRRKDNSRSWSHRSRSQNKRMVRWTANLRASRSSCIGSVRLLWGATTTNGEAHQEQEHQCNDPRDGEFTERKSCWPSSTASRYWCSFSGRCCRRSEDFQTNCFDSPASGQEAACDCADTSSCS